MNPVQTVFSTQKMVNSPATARKSFDKDAYQRNMANAATCCNDLLNSSKNIAKCLENYSKNPSDNNAQNLNKAYEMAMLANVKITEAYELLNSVGTKRELDLFCHRACIEILDVANIDNMQVVIAAARASGHEVHKTKMTPVAAKRLINVTNINCIMFENLLNKRSTDVFDYSDEVECEPIDE